MSVDYKVFESSQVITNPLLENARISEATGESPELYWIYESGEDKQVLWQPAGKLPEQFKAVVWNGKTGPRWELTISLWRRYRQISALEKGLILDYLAETLTEKDLLQRATEKLSIPRSSEWLNCYRRLTTLDSSLQNAVHEEEISLKIFRYIFQLPETIQEQLLEELKENNVHLTVQQARQLAESFRRISEVSGDKWNEIIQAAQKFSSQPSRRGDRLLKLVKEWAYPQISQKYKEFELLREQLDLYPDLQVTPPGNFEGSRLEIKIGCGDEEELNRALTSLKKCQRLLKFV